MLLLLNRCLSAWLLSIAWLNPELCFKATIQKITFSSGDLTLCHIAIHYQWPFLTAINHARLLLMLCRWCWWEIWETEILHKKDQSAALLISFISSDVDFIFHSDDQPIWHVLGGRCQVVPSYPSQGNVALMSPRASHGVICGEPWSRKDPMLFQCCWPLN